MKRLLYAYIAAGLLILGVITPLSQGFAQNAPAYRSFQKATPQTLEEAMRAPRVPGMPQQLKFPYKQPLEPVFDKVRFIKQEPPSTLRERIERLIHGIYVDIPPEYDLYGYEIRRYMAHIGGQAVLNSSQNIQGQLKNIKTAEIILRYWHKEIDKEASAIEAEIEETKASPSIRSSFKYHRGVAQAFFVEASSWLGNNRKLLEYLDGIGVDAYEFKDPDMTFKNFMQLQQYAIHLKARNDALEQIQGYTPFLRMVY